MISLRSIRKEHHEAGAFHALVGIEAAVADGVFATKAGDLVMMLRFRGADYECLDPDVIDAGARRFEGAIRLFGEDFRLYQYFLKRASPPLPRQHYANPIVEEAAARRWHYLHAKGDSLYVLDTYMAVVYEGARRRRDARASLKSAIARPAAAIRQTLSAEAAFESLQSDLAAARELIVNRVAGFVIQLRDFIDVETLDSQAAYRFLRRLLNYVPVKADAARLKYPNFVDFQACNSSLECHRDYLRLDDDYVQVLTLKEPPARTFAHLLRGLAEIPSNVIIATEWKRQDAGRVRQMIHSKRRRQGFSFQLSGHPARRSQRHADR